MATARRPQAGEVQLVNVNEATAVATAEAQAQAEYSDQRRNPRSQPHAPGVIFKRSDHPFHGQGTQVSLHAVRGLTRRGWLAVPYRFAIPPLDSWQHSFTGRMNAFDVVGGADGPAEHARPGGPGLQTVTFQALWMDWHPAHWGVWKPDQLAPILAVRELKQIARKNIIFRLRIRNPHLFRQDDVDMLATITQGDVEERAGEPDARYLTLSFQEYAELDAQRRSREKHQSDGPWTVKIKSGMTLRSLARDYYHEQSLWTVIANANPHMQNWAPSRDLHEWATKYHRTRITIPSKPKPSRVKGVALNVGGNRSQGRGSL